MTPLVKPMIYLKVNTSGHASQFFPRYMCKIAFEDCIFLIQRMPGTWTGATLGVSSQVFVIFLPSNILLTPHLWSVEPMETILSIVDVHS